MKKIKSLYIVIPAFNEERTIRAVLKDVKSVNFPVIVVDDGSTDKTSNISDRYADFVVRHDINLGKGAALKTGCEVAFRLGADAVVLFDSDGQHKASDLHSFIKALEEGREIVFGSRNLSMGTPMVRYLGNKFASVVVSTLFGIYVSDLICGYRALTKNAFKKMNWESVGYGVETEMVVLTAKQKLDYCEVPVQTLYYDSVKGVTILDAIGILFSVIRWRLEK